MAKIQVTVMLHRTLINAHYTTVYVGNLGTEISQVDLHGHFYSLGARVIDEVRVQRDKGLGFVRYSTHLEAALAIQLGNIHSYLGGRQMKCSWGSKPTPPGTTSNPFPPPGPAPVSGFTASDLLAYERQLAMGKMAGMNLMMHHPQEQHAIKQAAILGAAGSNQAMCDGGFQNV